MGSLHRARETTSASACSATTAAPRSIAKDYALTDTLRVFGEFAGIPTDSSPRLQKISGHAEIIKAFVTSILTGAPFSPSGEEGLDRARLIDAIYRSAELGREITIDEVSAGVRRAGVEKYGDDVR